MGSRFRAVTMAGGLALAACSPAKQEEAKTTAPGTGTEGGSAAAPSSRKAYFGAVHVHTSISFDAFTMGTRTMPEDAYRWARGEAIEPGLNGVKNQVQTPLDFYMVSEHSEMLGVFQEMQRPGSANMSACQVTSTTTRPRVPARRLPIRRISKSLRDATTNARFASSRSCADRTAAAASNRC